MVADSLPSFNDDDLHLKKVKKRNGDKKNKFKEKSNKQDNNVASKYGCQDGNRQKLLQDWDKFVSCNSKADNKEIEEYQQKRVDYDDQNEKGANYKKRKYEVINILKNPQFERRSAKLEVKEKQKENLVLLEVKNVTKPSKICDKEEYVDETNSKAKNDRQNMIKKCLSETSVKQYLQVAIEHEDTDEKRDSSKDEDSSPDEMYESLILGKQVMKMGENCKQENNIKMEERIINDKKVVSDIKEKDLINKYRQLESRGIFNREPHEMSSLMETALDNIKEGLNRLMMNYVNDSQIKGQGHQRKFKEKTILEKEKKVHEMMEIEENKDGLGKMGLQEVEKQNNNELDIWDRKTKKDQVTVPADCDSDKLTTRTDKTKTDKDLHSIEDSGSNKVETMMNLKNLQKKFNPHLVLKNVETLKQDVEMQLKAQLTDFQNFERKLETLQKKLTAALSDKNTFQMSPDVKWTELEQHSGNIFVPEKKEKSRISPLDKLKFSVRSRSCKGDNHGNQNNSNGNRQRGNSNKEHSGSDKESSRKHEEEKDRDEQEEPFDPPDNDKVDGPIGNESQNSNSTVLPNYKFRRKHGQLKDGSMQLMEIFGKLKDINENIPPDILEQLNLCLVNCLSDSSDTEECCICVCLSSLISHFGGCGSDYLQCTECIPIFSLIIQHVTVCIHNTQNGDDSCTVLCRKISVVASYDVGILRKRSSQLWTKLKKYMARFQVSVSPIGVPLGMDNDDLFSLSSLGSLSSVRSLTAEGITNKPPRVQRISTSYLPSLGIIPEKGGNFFIDNKPKPAGRGRKYPQSRSEPICRKLSDGTIQILKKDPGSPVNVQPALFLAEGQSKPVGASGRTGRRSNSEVLFTRQINEVRTITEERKTSLVRKVSFEQVERKIPEDEVDQKPLAIEEEDDDSEDKSWNEGVYGGNITSLPPGFQIPIRQGSSDQLLSLVETPTGVPGIGEVVYGTRQHFLKVIRHWTELKQQYQLNGFLPKHLREEGVILEEAKNARLLRIFGTRYQKNFQWVRMTHLGSGMSGKCHLCTDYNTEFQFCIKKLHISKYEESELDIWSELKHKHVVRLLGAMRYGEKIYIMQDFVDGGCLTETINRHKQMRRRLSHWTALCYLKQILEVLKYFQKKGIIHEDLKADNILLIQNTQKLAITDFGVAQRINNESRLRGTSPLGTPTQLSPEKAQSKGHGFKSDVWSAICVLVHMLSGSPPWVKRYPHAKLLNYIIVEHSPPLEDVPCNVSLDVQDLISLGFTVNPSERPSAEVLLKHRAFKLLDDYDPETFSSMLLTSTREIPGTILTEETENSNDDDYKILQQVQKDLKKSPVDDIRNLEPGVTSQPQNQVLLYTLNGSFGDPSSLQAQNPLGLGISEVQSSNVITMQTQNIVSTVGSQAEIFGGITSQMNNKTGSDGLRYESSGEPRMLQTQNPLIPYHPQIPSNHSQIPFGPDINSKSQIKNKSKRLTEILESCPNNSGPDAVEGAYYISREELERSGVCMPPDFESLIQNDPTDYYNEYLTDDKMENHLEQNSRYQNFLQFYYPEHKDPKQPECFPEYLDIEKCLEPSDLPAFEFLLPDERSSDNESSSSHTLDIHTQLNTQAIESMMNQSGSSSNIVDDFKRSSSHKEESLKLDEELDILRQQLPEALDLHDHQSIMDILNQPFTETASTKSHSSTLSGENMNSATNLKLDKDRIPSDSTPVTTLSEFPGTFESEKKTTVVNSGPSTLPLLGAHSSDPRASDQGPTTLPPVIINSSEAAFMNQFSTFHTEFNESFKSDELYASASEMISPSVVQNINNKMSRNEDFEETHPVSTKYSVKISNSKGKHDEIEEERVKTPIFDDEHLGAISDFSLNHQKEQLAVPDGSKFMSLQKQDSKKCESERKTSQTLRLELSPNSKRKQYMKGPNISNPEFNSYSSSPVLAQPFSTPQMPMTTHDFFTAKKDTGLGSSLPYWNQQRPGFDARRDSDSSGVVTTPPLHDPDQEIQSHIMDLVENLSQSSHDTSLYHLEAFDQDEMNLDKSPPSWMLRSTEEEESMYVHQIYLDHTTTGGTRITVETPDGQKCVSLSLTNEHRNRSWKDIIEADLAQQIHINGFRKFSLNDVRGKPVDLNAVPFGEQITVKIVEPTEQHWYSENNVMFDLGHF